MAWVLTKTWCATPYTVMSYNEDTLAHAFAMYYSAIVHLPFGQ